MSLDRDLLGPDADELARVADVIASITDADTERDQPPADLWDSIAARLGESDSPTVITAAPHLWATPDDEVPVQDADELRRCGTGRRSRCASSRAVGARRRRSRRRDHRCRHRRCRDERRRRLDPGSSSPASSSRPCAAPATANAELVEVDGAEALRITLDDLGTPPDGTHYELWLIDPDVTDPRSLGEVPPGASEVEVPVPDGVDPDRYPIVDINVQDDGVEEHSGLDTSILRGTLA